MKFKTETIDLKDNDGCVWKLSRMFDHIDEESFYVYRDGGSAFTLERKANEPKKVWLVFNDDPEADQYKNREEYLRALARSEHQMPLIGYCEFNDESLSQIFEWAIGQYLAAGWNTADVFSDSLATKPVQS
jgi:hypothetical protein